MTSARILCATLVAMLPVFTAASLAQNCVLSGNFPGGLRPRLAARRSLLAPRSAWGRQPYCFLAQRCFDLFAVLRVFLRASASPRQTWPKFPNHSAMGTVAKALRFLRVFVPAFTRHGR